MATIKNHILFAFEPVIDNGKIVRDIRFYKGWISDGLEPAAYDFLDNDEPPKLKQGDIQKGGNGALVLFVIEVDTDTGDIEFSEVDGAKLSTKTQFVFDDKGYLCDAKSEEVPMRIFSYIFAKYGVSSAFCAAEIIADAVTRRILAPYVDTIPLTDTTGLNATLEKVYQFVSKKLLKNGAIKIKGGSYTKGTKTEKFIKFVDDAITDFIAKLEEKKEATYGTIKRDATDTPQKKYNDKKLKLDEEGERMYILCGNKEVGTSEDENALCFAISALINTYKRQNDLILNEVLHREAIEKETDERKKRKRIKEYQDAAKADLYILENIQIEEKDGYVVIDAPVSTLLDVLFGRKATPAILSWLNRLILRFSDKKCVIYTKGEKRLRKTVRHIISDFTTEIEDNTITANCSLKSAKNLKPYQDADEEEIIADLFESEYARKLTSGNAKEIRYRIGILKDALLLPEEQGKQSKRDKNGKPTDHGHNALNWDVLKYIYSNERYTDTASKVFGWARQIIRRKRNTNATQITVDAKEIGYDHAKEWRQFPLLRDALQIDGIILEVAEKDGKAFFTVTQPVKIDSLDN